MPPPSVIKFLKEQEAKKEQLRQQLANQEVRRAQEEIEKREAKEIVDYLFSEYDEARARSHPPPVRPPPPPEPTEAQLAHVNVVGAAARKAGEARLARSRAPSGSAEAARLNAAVVAAEAEYEAELAEYKSTEDYRRAAEEHAAALAAYEERKIANSSKNEQEVRDKAKEIGDRLFRKYHNNLGRGRLFKNEVSFRPDLQNAIKKGYQERFIERRKAQQINSKKAEERKKEEERAVEEATKEAERQRIRERNEKEKRDKEEELERLRVSLRPRVEKDVAQKGWAFFATLGHTQYSPLTGNKVYDEMFAELIQPRVEQFQKEKSRKGVEEAYEYISRRQKDGIKHLGQWTGSEITPTEEEILERLKKARNGGTSESEIVKEIFNEYLKASNHSGGRRKTRRGRKHRRRSTHRKH